MGRNWIAETARRIIDRATAALGGMTRAWWKDLAVARGKAGAMTLCTGLRSDDDEMRRSERDDANDTAPAADETNVGAPEPARASPFVPSSSFMSQAFH